MEQLLTLKDLTRMTHLKDRTLRNHVAPRGRLVPCRIGKRLVFRPEDVKRWLDENAAQDSAQ